MAAPCSQQAVLQQVSQLWSLLDDLSESSPEGYRRFIQQQLKDGADYYSSPQAHSCLRTEILEPEEGVLYVNVCSWKRVPTPESHSSPVPLCASKLATGAEGKEVYSVIDVAFSPETLRRAEGDGEERDQLLRLALLYAEQNHGLRLSPCYTLTSANIKGPTQRMRDRLATPLNTSAHSAPEEGGSLLQQICALQQNKEKEEEKGCSQLFPQEVTNPAKGGLIQELSSTTTVAQPQEPRYKLAVIQDGEGRPHTLQLTVDLPGISSISECKLSISQDDVLIEVEDLYHLQLDLPETVNEEAASATFSKKTRILSVTVPIL
ncbi:PIH1 domain-containing protein 2 isoform X1 [Lepisosteus oculatus]|uniref:PIH1 domain-containing protein 2 n=1 Tax=Lepisosteus oculatus TaxID=7918 RepID=W5M037_LEPOC|nr:PREDICTED: PIH1 domain-containing protein 2 isoform X1 [Lepisosteus oculatus]